MEILEKLNIKTNQYDLYKTALTHTSYANENNIESYERLEYLGDAVLELVMSEYLYKTTKFFEGEMTKLRSNYVCENALYEYAIKLNLNEYLLLGHGELESGKYRKAIVADVFEAFLGAIYLDKGLAVAKKFIYDNVIELIENKEIVFDTDYKTTLQELIQTEKRTLKYIIVNEEGPAHLKTFTIEARIDEIVYGKGSAHSKKEAEQLAAKNALEKCAKL